MISIWVGVGGCIGEGVTERWEVDQLEGDVAIVVQPKSGARRAIDPSSVPPGAREGDVIIDGRVDPGTTRALKQEVSSARREARRLSPSRPTTLDEGPGSSGTAPRSARSSRATR